MRVLNVNGNPNIGPLSMAVITSSMAEANAFKIELSFLRKRLVANPRRELLSIISNTIGVQIDWIDVIVKTL